MAEERDTKIENAFGDAVGRLANPLIGPAAFASFGFQMMRSSIMFWSEFAESMARSSAAAQKAASVSPLPVPPQPRPAPAEEGRVLPPAPPKMRIVASGEPRARKAKPADKAKTDDLKAISGIGPKVEHMLNGSGISSYAQLAELDTDAIARLDDKLGFAGRIGRDDWVGQARALMAGEPMKAGNTQ